MPANAAKQMDHRHQIDDVGAMNGDWAGLAKPQNPSLLLRVPRRQTQGMDVIDKIVTGENPNQIDEFSSAANQVRPWIAR